MDNRYMTCALKVATPFPGWNWMLKRELENIGGLSYYIDSDGTVHVSGKTDPYLIVHMLGKSGIHVVISQISGDYQYKNKPLKMRNWGNIYGHNYYGSYGSYMPFGRMDYYRSDPTPRYWHHHYPYYPYYHLHY